jgi:hypothetical protein
VIIIAIIQASSIIKLEVLTILDKLKKKQLIFMHDIIVESRAIAMRWSDMSHHYAILELLCP